VKLRQLLAVIVLAAVAIPPSATAATGLLLGIDDDSLKWAARPAPLLNAYEQLGVGAVRVTLDWTPGQTFATGTARMELNRIAAASSRIRIVIAVTGPPDQPPLDAVSRGAYCSYVASLLRRMPSVRDVAIWTEPNSAVFWRPQKGAPAAYEALLATCWDALHAVRPDANVIATSSPHANPAAWYRGLGAAYRASGRTQPIFDTVGHNAYPQTSAESPAAVHANGPIDQGDLDRLLAALSAGFAGTGQPLPGSGGVTVWYMEDGFQSAPPPGLGGYSGTETDAHAVSEEQQAAQLTAAIRLAYCQRAVGAFFNFELRDDPSLGGWQSGLLRADWTLKPSFTAYLDAVQSVRTSAVSCGPR
jgi:hypothetical protein